MVEVANSKVEMKPTITNSNSYGNKSYNCYIVMFCGRDVLPSILWDDRAIQLSFSFYDNGHQARAAKHFANNIIGKCYNRVSERERVFLNEMLLADCYGINMRGLNCKTLKKSAIQSGRRTNCSTSSFVNQSTKIVSSFMTNTNCLKDS